MSTEEKKSNVIPAESNEHALALVKDLELSWSLAVGDYQGQVLVGLTDKERVFVYLISYGSCGGCDWFEGYYGKDIPFKDAVDAFGDEKPLYVFPKSWFAKVDPAELHKLLFSDGYQGMNPEYGWTEGAAKELIEACTKNEGTLSRTAKP